MADLTPYTWINAVAATLEAMPWWLESGDDRTPEIRPGYPFGWLDGCDCDNGQALVTAGPVFYAGERFPDEDILSRPIARGGAVKWAVNITVRYGRCRPVVDSNGRGPTAAEVTAYAEGLYDDGTAIWHALQCRAPYWRANIGSVVVRGYGPDQTLLETQCSGFQYDLTCEVATCSDCPDFGDLS